MARNRNGAKERQIRLLGRPWQRGGKKHTEKRLAQEQSTGRGPSPVGDVPFAGWGTAPIERQSEGLVNRLPVTPTFFGRSWTSYSGTDCARGLFSVSHDFLPSLLCLDFFFFFLFFSFFFPLSSSIFFSHSICMLAGVHHRCDTEHEEGRLSDTHPDAQSFPSIFFFHFSFFFSSFSCLKRDVIIVHVKWKWNS
jgi:hypothetical protein